MVSRADRPLRSVLVVAVLATLSFACNRDSVAPAGPNVGPSTSGATPGGGAQHLLPRRLAFTRPPGTVTAGALMDPVEVAVVDSLGALIADTTDTVALALTGPSGTLAGTLLVPFAGGHAAFADLRVDAPGAGYRLVAIASDTAIARVTSPDFGVSRRVRSLSGECALTDEGAAYCWGRNDDGQVGTGTYSPPGASLPPSRVVGGLSFASITHGMHHVCGLTASGEAWCWGNNAADNLGVTDVARSATAVRVGGGLAFASLSAGDTYTCGLTGGGAAYCWGYNRFGQLGDGTDSLRSTPTPVAGGHTFTSLATLSAHTCGIEGDGSVWCWGANENGQLATGDTLPRFAPFHVPGTTSFESVRTSYEYTCGIALGKVYCWGSFLYQLSLPTLMPAADSAASFASAELSGCMLNARGKVFCWGDIGTGPYPDNSEIITLTPAPIGLRVPLAVYEPRFQFDSPDDASYGLGLDGTVWRYDYNPAATPNTADRVTYLARRVFIY